MYTYRMDGGKINPEIAYRADTLLEPKNIRARQAASTVHVHPNGRFLYGANRAQDTVDFEGRKVFKGGENSIVVYSINQTTGEPTADPAHRDARHPSAHLPHRSERPPAWWCSTTCRWTCATATRCKTVPAGLSVFRIGDDGKLTFVRKYDIDVGRQRHVLDGDGAAVALAIIPARRRE